MRSHEFLEFKECRAMATKILHASLDVHHAYELEDLILQEFEEEANSLTSLNADADTGHDNFNDCMRMLNESHKYSQLLKEYFSDAAHHGRPTRWLKFSNNLALQGKTRSGLIIKRSTYRDSEDGQRIRQIDCELHQSVRPERHALVVIMPFTLSAKHYGNWSIEDSSLVSEKENSSFYAFVFPGLEALGFGTPLLDTWSGSWKGANPVSD